MTTKYDGTPESIKQHVASIVEEAKSINTPSETLKALQRMVRQDARREEAFEAVRAALKAMDASDKFSEWLP